MSIDNQYAVKSISHMLGLIKENLDNFDIHTSI